MADGVSREERLHDRRVLEQVFTLLGNDRLGSLGRQVTGAWVLEADIGALERYLALRSHSPLASSRLQAAFLPLDAAVGALLAHLDRGWVRVINPRSVRARKPAASSSGDTLPLLAACSAAYNRVVDEVKQIYPDLPTNRRLY